MPNSCRSRAPPGGGLRGRRPPGALRGPSRGGPVGGRRSPTAPACGRADGACAPLLTLLATTATLYNRRTDSFCLLVEIAISCSVWLALDGSLLYPGTSSHIWYGAAILDKTYVVGEVCHVCRPTHSSAFACRNGWNVAQNEVTALSAPFRTV